MAGRAGTRTRRASAWERCVSASRSNSRRVPRRGHRRAEPGRRPRPRRAAPNVERRPTPNIAGTLNVFGWRIASKNGTNSMIHLRGSGATIWPRTLRYGPRDKTPNTTATAIRNDRYRDRKVAPTIAVTRTVAPGNTPRAPSRRIPDSRQNHDVVLRRSRPASTEYLIAAPAPRVMPSARVSSVKRNRYGARSTVARAMAAMVQARILGFTRSRVRHPAKIRARMPPLMAW